MSDQDVANALRSESDLVVVEAPAGCGKTHQAADYARDTAGQLDRQRLLILTHTHAACDVFATRTRGVSSRVEIRTLDSLINQIATTYHKSLGLPSDVNSWVRRTADGHKQLASKTAALLKRAPMIASSLAQRYPLTICDEYQDSNAHQHEVVMAIHDAASRLRIFGDPMQLIYERAEQDRTAAIGRWNGLVRMSGGAKELETPHRWIDGATELGQWILSARATLKRGGTIDLRGNLPTGLQVIRADNDAARHGQYQVQSEARRPIDNVVRNSERSLILATQNLTVRSLRAFFNRSISVWEGHTRDALDSLVAGLVAHKGDARASAEAMIEFLGEVAVGFSPSAYGNIILQEIASNCSTTRRGKPAIIQNLARLIANSPDHRGVTAALKQISQLIETDSNFSGIKIDHPREFREAIKLSEFDDPEIGFAEITRRRTFARAMPPRKAVSTVHKAKGLDCDHVLVLPCDSQHFRDSDHHRCLLYVALSRARRSLTLVVSPRDPSPLISI